MSGQKRKRSVNFEDLKNFFKSDPIDHKKAWEDLRDRVLQIDSSIQAPAQTLAPSSLSLPEAEEIFSLTRVTDVLWAKDLSIDIPVYLLEAIERIVTITSFTNRSNEAYSRTVIDQIVISALYEENQSTLLVREKEKGTSEPAQLELQHEVQFSKQVTLRGQPRMLNGFCDYTIFYEPRTQSALATNVVIVEAKKAHATDTCLGQLTAYMGVVHTSRKEEKRANSVVFGVASDGLSFRFLRIDNESNISQSRLLEWHLDSAQIYSIFRQLIRLAALQSPSSSPIKDPGKREKVVASFGSPERVRHFDYDLNTLNLIEEDEETEVVSL
ncbi:MAG: hypothetical protein L6R38_008972 [Xanthoria sp. 2 TBL-2021]|nr:MAG: hypothetical protein L6R38_008972 [Xanthoria sp. 2 TBL-2021]